MGWSCGCSGRRPFLKEQRSVLADQRISSLLSSAWGRAQVGSPNGSGNGWARIGDARVEELILPFWCVTKILQMVKVVEMDHVRGQLCTSEPHQTNQPCSCGFRVTPMRPRPPAQSPDDLG